MVVSIVPEERHRAAVGSAVSRVLACLSLGGCVNGTAKREEPVASTSLPAEAELHRTSVVFA